MFQKILIANRGEIACRVIQTAKRMGIQTVAIYSEADKHALHVKLADEAYFVGPAASNESYLNIENIINVALASHAKAIHPGYGFLSENAEFVEACQHNNLHFIGPSPSAIKKMGEKNTAKDIMESAKVPVIRGYHGENQDSAFLAEKAKEITFPVLIKAVAGGGGKGMRVAESQEEFGQALLSAKSEAKTSFGNDAVLLEQYLPEARHVEVQVFADKHNHAVYLYERDCSLQRRHQKILEEAPAPNMTPKLRKAMGEAAVNAAKSIHYEGAGTVEFLLVPDNEFYFMEMNTRLQVEHPVTEKITGLDLVEWQLRIANGEPLPIANQSDIPLMGHAIEARIYAENPDKQFTPSTGTLNYFHTPEQNKYVRVDTGVTQGDDISVYYDPMIAKLIVWGEDRATAISHLNRALSQFNIADIQTNIALLTAITENKAFQAAELNTHFIEKHQTTLIPETKSTPEHILALATLVVLGEQNKNIQKLKHSTQDTYSPWLSGDSWRLNLPALQHIHLKTDHEAFDITVEMPTQKQYKVTTTSQSFNFSDICIKEHTISAITEKNSICFNYALINHHIYLFINGKTYTLRMLTHELDNDSPEESNKITAPMPGTIITISVTPGQTVLKGERLVVIEAMKMQHTLFAPDNAIVKEVLFDQGDLIEEGAELVLLENESECNPTSTTGESPCLT